MKQNAAAVAFGITPQAVCGWMRRYRDGGEEVLAVRKRGPKQGRAKLNPRQCAWVCGQIVGKNPDQLRLPYFLWTRDAVCELVWMKYKIRITAKTMGRYLRSWGLTPQKPIRRAFEQNSEAHKRWLEVDYPQIKARAAIEGGEIYWGDEMGVRSDHQAGTSWAPKGRTPVVNATGKRFSANTISAITNRGKLAFRIFTGSFTADIAIDFARRLIRHAGSRKVFLILDGHPVHRSHKFRDWIAAHSEQIELIILPGYSPDLNPDELLNNDIKQVVGRNRPNSRDELVASLRSHLHKRQKQPGIVRRFFNHPNSAYAA